ncbi:MAG: phage tail protein [Clostridium sp.]|nr:phage tail protein [Clostridium sp.]
MLQLFDVNKNKIKGLSAYKDYCIESKLKTGDKTLSFLYPKHLSKELKEEGYIRNKTDEFVIKEISNSGNYKSIKAVLNVEDLEGKEWEHFTTTNQTINQCISLALAGTGWTLRMIDNISKKRTIKKTNCNSWDIIQEARKTYNAEIEFDTISKIVKVAERLGSDKGAYFIDSLNLKDLKSQSNSYDFYTRIVALGKDDLKVIVENFKYSNKTKTLIWKDEKYTDEASLREDAIIKLDEISKPYHAYDADILDLANMSDKYKDILSYKLGDVITLISKDEYIREKQRIVSMKVWPDKPEKNSCEIANTILSFEDLQKEHQNTADTVNNVTSDNGTISEGAIQGVVKKLVVDKADINSLNAVEIRVGDIEATKANITELKVTNATVDKLTANKADVIQLNAVSEKVNLLEADSANIKTLVAGNITADNIQSDLLQSLKGWMLEGSIGNAQISDLDANKIKSGTVDTSLVSVAGPQGRLKLQGNKLQVLDSKDNALYERIMLGVDENNNSALVLRGNDGKTILLNQDGLTKAGFTDGYNKIDNNSLDGSKLDINSVVRKVNGATEKISSTVVQAGDKSLNVLLQEQNNNITEHGKNLATQEARITANEKAINLKVDSQTYATDKTTINKNIETTLTNSKAYADAKKSEAISTAATDATTKANAAKDSAVSTAASDATTKANNAKDTAISEAQKKADKALSDSKAYVNQEITTVNSNLSKATSEISVLKGQIALKVEQGDIDKTVTTVKNELDSKIANVTTTTDTKINTAKSEIKAETDKIKLSVTGLDSKTKAIETQMDDKATKSEIKIVSDKAATIEANLGGITQRVSSTESKVNTLTGNVTDQEKRLKVAENKITDEAIINTVSKTISDAKYDTISISKAVAGGKMLFSDPTFTEGVNGLSLYNLSGGTHLKMNRIAKPSDCPTTSSHCMEFSVDGINTDPGNGGFHFDGLCSRANAIFITKIRAKIPEGLAINWHSNPTGVGRIDKWLTSNVGTGKWEEYIHETICGISGTFSTTEFYAIAGGTPPFKWHIASATVYDITDTNDLNLRVAHAETKITDDAIINTVKDAKTNGKATFATTSTVEQLNDQVNFKFSSTGGRNLIKNGLMNETLAHWHDNGGGLFHDTTWFFGGKCGASRFPTGISGEYIYLKPLTDYVFSCYFWCENAIASTSIKPLHFWCATSQGVADTNACDLVDYKQKYDGADVKQWVQLYIHIRTKGSPCWFRPFFYTGDSQTGLFNVTQIMMAEGKIPIPFSPHPDEVYAGNTKIDADGVEIYNGALTVKNKAGNKVIEADSTGDITFKGKLQPNDYQLKLFGNDCRIDGSASAIRMQLTPHNYISMDSSGYMRVFNQRSNSGNNYVSLGVNEEGHTILFCGTTMLKLLGGSAPGVQARWGGDGGYCPMVASDFVNNSTIKAKTNISSLNIENAINIIKENNVRNYQLKSDIDNEMQQENVEYDNKSVIYAGNAPIKTGLIIEELTPQAKALLVPKDTDCISLYSMVSLLWGVVQEQQKEIEELKSLVNRG